MTTPANFVRRTRIVCTMGPACWQPHTLRQLFGAGMNVARINFSHAEYDTTEQLIGNLRGIAAELGSNLAILADLQGPRIRIGKIPAAGIKLVDGADFSLYADPSHAADANGAPIDYALLPQDVHSGDRVLIEDGLMELRVTAVAAGEVRTRVVTGGLLRAHKGINLPGVTLSVPTITAKDKADLGFALAQGVDMVALSFVRSAADVQQLRGLIAAHGVARPLVLSKIEKHEAADPDTYAAILAASDGIMVARGDLGVEMPTEQLPILQKWMIRLARAAGKPVITATQMLDSMIRNPHPTRAEATDVANAIFDGTDATMLSGETASGSYPVQAVQTMASIAVYADQYYLSTLAPPRSAAPSQLDQQPDIRDDHEAISRAVGQAIVTTASALQAKAIVTITSSGYTARHIARLRPTMPIVAISNSEATNRQLAVTWGVIPFTVDTFSSFEQMEAAAERSVIAVGVAAAGDTIVISAGLPLNLRGRTNVLKVRVVGEKLAKGQCKVGRTTVRP